jgi:hypothetical protein
MPIGSCSRVAQVIGNESDWDPGLKPHDRSKVSSSKHALARGQSKSWGFVCWIFNSVGECPLPQRDSQREQQRKIDDRSGEQLACRSSRPMKRELQAEVQKGQT